MNRNSIVRTILICIFGTLLLFGCATQPPAQPGGASIDATDKKQSTPENIQKAHIILAKSRRAIATEWANKTFEEFEQTVSGTRGWR